MVSSRICTKRGSGNTLIPMYVQEFLIERENISGQNKKSSSEAKRQDNCVSQGSVLAVTLFALKINRVTKLIPNRPSYVASLYVDDIQIEYRHSGINEAKVELQ